MPQPSNPPYEAGALLQPRQLNRWLDVNKVHKLTRTETYFTLPAFEVTYDWLGFSDIVAVFNYAATNNFSLPLQYVVPDEPNYLACVMWCDDEGNSYRYKLWEHDTAVIFAEVPVYTGQLIKSNFRIEIWSVGPSEFPSEITATGFGELLVDGSYTYIGNQNYDGSGGIEVRYVAGKWRIWNGADTFYIIDEDNIEFPFGLWTRVDGDAPVGLLSTEMTASQSEELTFITSVAGEYDYMWQNDNTLATPSTIVTEFGWPLVDGDFPLPFEWPADSVPVTN